MSTQSEIRPLRMPRLAGLSPRLRWLLAGLGLLLVAFGLMVVTGVRPGYDPYGWLVWGHLTIHGTLNTDGAPSWKPLPFLFTLPYALVGRDAVYLWMTTAFALSLSGLGFAWRLTFGLIAPPPERRWAAHVAGLAAALAIAGIYQYPHSILTSQADTIVTALVLAGADCLLRRRWGWAFALWWLASLGRPEAWCLLGVYAVWASVRRPPLRPWIVLGLLAIPLLWFGIPALTSHSPFSGANLAEGSIRALHGNKLIGVASRFAGLNAAAVKLAALLAVVVAVLRRERAVLVLAAGVALWLAVEVAFALHGWSAVQRYIYAAAAGVCVLAGVGVGRVLIDGPVALGRLRLSPRWAATASLAVLAVWALALAPAARTRILQERRDLREQRQRASQIEQLQRAVDHLGVGRILACGQPRIDIAWQSALAFLMGTNVGSLFFNPHAELRRPHPIEQMVPKPHGWSLYPQFTTTPQQAQACRGLVYRT